MPSLVPERDPRIAWRSAADIRARFLDYFAERGHAIVPSSSLVPAGDNTLLFVNSGMVPFKDALTGAEKRSYTRAVNFHGGPGRQIGSLGAARPARPRRPGFPLRQGAQWALSSGRSPA